MYPSSCNCCTHWLINANCKDRCQNDRIYDWRAPQTHPQRRRRDQRHDGGSGAGTETNRCGDGKDTRKCDALLRNRGDQVRVGCADIAGRALTMDPAAIPIAAIAAVMTKRVPTIASNFFSACSSVCTAHQQLCTLSQSFVPTIRFPQVPEPVHTRNHPPEKDDGREEEHDGPERVRIRLAEEAGRRGLRTCGRCKGCMCGSISGIGMVERGDHVHSLARSVVCLVQRTLGRRWAGRHCALMLLPRLRAEGKTRAYWIVPSTYGSVYALRAQRGY